MIHAHYNNTHMCGHDHAPQLQAIDLISWTNLINNIAKNLHNGKLKPSDLNDELIQKTYTELEAGASKGYGKGWIKFDTANSKTVQELKQNIYTFSGAKTYQQLAEMNSFLVDKKGKIRNYSDFRKEVFKVHKKYNKNYLQSEYQTAKRSGQASRQWKGYEANSDLFPNLKYRTIGDDRVRDDHQTLDGIIKPINDAFWDTHYPPNGWRCRCSVQPTSDKATTQKITVAPDKGFGINVGKTNKMFNENDHPYFVFPKADEKDIKTAFENFKLTASYGKARYIGKNGGKVFVSPFTDTRPAELIGNYKVAIKIVKELKTDVKLRPHLNGQIVSKPNPEYLIGNKIADRKAPTSKNYKKVLSSANSQECEIVVIDLSRNSDTIKNAKLKVNNVLKFDKNHPFIKEVYFVSSDRKVLEVVKRKKQP